MKWPRGAGITRTKRHFLSLERTPTESFAFTRGDATRTHKGCLFQRATLCCWPLWVKPRFLRSVISTFPAEEAS